MFTNIPITSYHKIILLHYTLHSTFNTTVKVDTYCWVIAQRLSKAILFSYFIIQLPEQLLTYIRILHNIFAANSHIIRNHDTIIQNLLHCLLSIPGNFDDFDSQLYRRSILICCLAILNTIFSMTVQWQANIAPLSTSGLLKIVLLLSCTYHRSSYRTYQLWLRDFEFAQQISHNFLEAKKEYLEWHLLRTSRWRRRLVLSRWGNWCQGAWHCKRTRDRTRSSS